MPCLDDYDIELVELGPGIFRAGLWECPCCGSEVLTEQVQTCLFCGQESVIGEFPDQEWHPHDIPLKAYLLSKYPVTNAQFARFATEIQYSSTSKQDDLLVIDSSRVMNGIFDWGVHEIVAGTWRPAPGCDNLPAVNVTGAGAKAFAEYFGGRLPTEEEWCYATSTSRRQLYDWGDSLCLNFDPKLFRPFPVNDQRHVRTAEGVVGLTSRIWEFCSYKDSQKISLKGGDYFNPLFLQRTNNAARLPRSTWCINMGFRICFSHDEV